MRLQLQDIKPTRKDTYTGFLSVSDCIILLIEASVYYICTHILYNYKEFGSELPGQEFSYSFLYSFPTTFNVFLLDNVFLSADS